MPRDSGASSRRLQPLQHGSPLPGGETTVMNISSNATASTLANVSGGNAIQNTNQEMPPNQEHSVHVFRSSEPRPNTSKNHIPRPPNMFILFRRAKLHELQNRSIEGDKTALVVKWWKELSPEQRKYWEELAKVEKANHAKKYPNYKFKPVHKRSKDGGLVWMKNKKDTVHVKRVGDMSTPGESASEVPAQSQATEQSKPVELPANWYYVKGGDRAHDHQRPVAVPQLPTNYMPPPAPTPRKEQAAAPVAPSTSFSSTPIYPDPINNSSVSSGRRLHMDQPLGPDSLLLQSFSYKEAAHRMAISRANRAHHANNNSSSSSFVPDAMNNVASTVPAMPGIEQVGNPQFQLGNIDPIPPADDFWSLITNENGGNINAGGFATAFGDDQLMETSNGLGVNGLFSIFDNQDIIASAPPTVRPTEQFVVPPVPWWGSVTTPRAPTRPHSFNSSSNQSAQF